MVIRSYQIRWDEPEDLEFDRKVIHRSCGIDHIFYSALDRDLITNSDTLSNFAFLKHIEVNVNLVPQRDIHKRPRGRSEKGIVQVFVHKRLAWVRNTVTFAGV